MGKRFTPTGDADRRAIRFYHQIRAIIETLPSVEVRFTHDGKKVRLCKKTDSDYRTDYTVDEVLMLDVEQAVRDGGTWIALVRSRKAVRPRVPQAEIDEAVQEFLDGEE
jgi:hypothetical protein